MDKIEKINIALFGIGYECAEEFINKNGIGLGEPKVAFSVGFQRALDLIRKSGIVDLDDLKKTIHLYEKNKGKELTDFTS